MPASFFEETSLVGPEVFLRDRLQEFRQSGVNSLNVSLVGETRRDRVATLDKLRDVIVTLGIREACRIGGLRRPPRESERVVGGQSPPARAGPRRLSRAWMQPGGPIPCLK